MWVTENSWWGNWAGDFIYDGGSHGMEPLFDLIWMISGSKSAAW